MVKGRRLVFAGVERLKTWRLHSPMYQLTSKGDAKELSIRYVSGPRNQIPKQTKGLP